MQRENINLNKGGKQGKLIRRRKFLISEATSPEYSTSSESRTVAHTTRRTVNRRARKLIHLNYVVSERGPKGGINISRETKARFDR